MELNEFYGMDKQNNLKYRVNDLNNFVDNMWIKLEKLEAELIKDNYNLEERKKLLHICETIKNISETLYDMTVETYKKR